MSNPIIVHIVHRDKFTSGYINYMNETFPQYDHRFVLHANGFPLDLRINEGLLYVGSFNCLAHGDYYRLLKSASKIIVTGVFLYRECLAFLHKKIIKKTFLHFWGGDFYFAREKGIKTFLKKIVLGYLIKYCRATVLLIEGDVKELNRLFPNHATYYVAGMPGDPKRKIDYDKIMANSPDLDIVRIIIGNSATPENHHKEVFELIAAYRSEPIEIYCPLSYGDIAYREKVIDVGKELFGNKFFPILEFLDKEEYMTFLSTCSIGIYNNDRQQAMGNISSLLRMGKKVYIRDTTSMWERYVSNGLILYPISQLSNKCLFQEFIVMREEDRQHNISCSKEFMENNRRKMDESWQRILEI